MRRRRKDETQILQVPQYRSDTPSAGKGTGRKPQKGEIVQRGAGGKILRNLTKKLWGGDW